MKRLKVLFAIVLVFTILVTGAIPVSAAFENVYNEDKKLYATEVEEQGNEGDCLYYATLSAAGSYARKYYGIEAEKANFSESNLKENIGANYDMHNFGEILYKSVGCGIGNDFFITSVEMLSNRGRRYIQERVKENGAVIAVIALPENGDMENESYYNSENNSFFCPSESHGNKKYHAVTIVGWDEKYSWTNFSTEPDRAGAWICKNSYGESYGDEGYFYLSYNQDLIYAASLEVTYMGGLSYVYSQDDMFRHLGFVNGIAVRAFENNITDNITVTVGKKTAFSGDVKLKNGYTLIPFEYPVPAGKITVNGSKISKSQDTVYCYWSLFKHSVPMDIKPVCVDEEWIEWVDRISISIKPERYFARNTNSGSVVHLMEYSSVDNCFYITPCDGYRFDENTFVGRIDGFYAFRGGTIAQITENYPSAIRFDKGDDGRGRLIITGQSVGGAFITGINLVTDEKGLPSFVVLAFDNGSTKELSLDKLDIKLYSDEAFQNEITDISGLSKYYLKVGNLPSNTADVYTVSVNGEEINVTISDENEIEVEITIPDVEMKRGEFLEQLTKFRVRIRKLFILGRK